jgi:hypothetical protein
MASDTAVPVKSNPCLSTKASTAVPSLSDASVWRMLVNDNSLVAWYRIRECCPVAVLSALIAQREQLAA